MYQYRITIDGNRGSIADMYPGNEWSYMADIIEERGINATLERRLITDKTILDLIEDTTGYITIKDLVICPWETIAELINR